ncbi:TIGR01212 family radical SAM protein [Candidatus Aerophobetes bacterium]|nr:TIGR01212 family radical SAM protein [Candidatus Aerophobetes bacterium]
MRDRYYKFSTYLKERFGERVHKVSVDANFSCPNRDGKISTKGCIFCNNEAFSLHTRTGGRGSSLEEQIRRGIEAAKKRFKAKKFIVYFQAYTNTYAPIDVLKKKYDVIKKFKDIVGLSIATRPDCIDEETLNLIESYKNNYEVWLEYGLQSIHNKTLKFINRGHTFEDFLKAVEITRKHKIKICTHIIIGLPYETKDMILETAKKMAHLKIESIKIHPLHIVRRTTLEKLFRQGKYTPLELNTYLDILVDFLAYLWPKTVIQRVGAYCPPNLLVAPLWILERNRVEKELEKRLIEKDYFQGKFY